MPATTLKRPAGRPSAPRTVAVEAAMDGAALASDNQEWDRREWPALHQVARLVTSIAQHPTTPATARVYAREALALLGELIDGDRQENMRNARLAQAARRQAAALEALA